MNVELIKALRAAEQAGLSIVVSAGNDGKDLDDPDTLKDIGQYLRHAIIVGAVDRHNMRATFPKRKGTITDGV